MSCEFETEPSYFVNHTKIAFVRFMNLKRRFEKILLIEKTETTTKSSHFEYQFDPHSLAS